MSRTYRNNPTYVFRPVKTFNELKQVKVSDDFYDEDYKVSTRHRYIPTSYDDIRPSSYNQLDHHRK